MSEFPPPEQSWGSFDGVDFDDPEVRDRLARFTSVAEPNRYMWCPGLREWTAWRAFVRSGGAPNAAK